MYNDQKVGLGVITCDRVDFFNNCINSIIDTHQGVIDELVVVNDGEQVVDSSDNYTLIHNKKNLGVGKTKNKALKRLMKCGCDHIFLVEDDVTFINEHVLSTYIQLSQLSGVQHLNFCLHGNDNKINNKPNPKLVVDYKHVKMSLYHNVYGALSYYTRECLDNVGYMDKQYNNAMEHVDHTMQTIVHGYHPPFRWFADVHDSHKLLQEQDHGHSESKIRNEAQWRDNFVHGVKLFYERYNINVCSTAQTYDTKEQAIDFLKFAKP